MTDARRSVPDVGAEPLAHAPKQPLLRAFASVALANTGFIVLTAISGPLAARALGPVGRGRLAAILVPFGWAPVLFNFGLPSYSTRAAARNESLSALVGTLGIASIALGLLGAALSVPAAHMLAPHDSLVRTYIIAGLALLPLTLIGAVGSGFATGRAEWSRLNRMRIIPPTVVVVGYVALLLANKLTVASAAIVVYVGSLLALLPLSSVLRTVGTPTVNMHLLARASTFGGKAWLANLASQANYRLDQLLMIPLVSSRQLGFYAVAVTVSGLMGAPIGALSTVINPRVARGDTALLGRAVRITVGSAFVFATLAALAVPWLLPAIFGTRFSGATTMCIVLLAAAVPGSTVWVLGITLQTAGHPEIPARGEIAALALTIPGLLILLPSLAGLGAAIVSAAAYTVNLTTQLLLARSRLDLGISDLLIPRRQDFVLVGSTLTKRLQHT